MSKLINKEALRQSLIKVKQYIDDKLFGNSESLKDLISEEISKGLSTIVDSAPEAFDTLKEVADWIAQDETHSAGIIEQINNIPLVGGTGSNSSILKDANNTAQTAYSSAFGRDNVAKGHASFVEGRENKANGDASHAEGYKTKAAYVGHSEGQETIAQGDASHAEGNLTIAYGNVSHAEGNKTTAYGDRSHAEGTSTNEFTAIEATDGDYQTAWETNNDFSMSFGNNSHIEGGNNFAGGAQSHAEGWKTEAIGENSHTEGTLTKAVGKNAHAEGGNTLAEGNHSHAGGWQSKAVGAASHASGYYTETNNRGEAAFGNFNVSVGDSDESENTAFSVGIGTKSSDRKNAFEVKQSGDIYIKGVEGRIQDGIGIAIGNTAQNHLNNLKALNPNNKLRYLGIPFIFRSTNPEVSSFGIWQEDDSYLCKLLITKVTFTYSNRFFLEGMSGGFLVTITDSWGTGLNFRNLELDQTIEDFGGVVLVNDMVNRITQLENIINEITTQE